MSLFLFVLSYLRLFVHMMLHPMLELKKKN
eukprot:gene18006-23644_t